MRKLADDLEILLRSRREEPLSPEDWRRVKVRLAWVRKTLAKWHAAIAHRDERCAALAGKLGEAEFEALVAAEEAKCDVHYDQIRAVIEHDKWPRHLHWGGI